MLKLNAETNSSEKKVLKSNLFEFVSNKTNKMHFNLELHFMNQFVPFLA